LRLLKGIAVAAGISLASSPSSACDLLKVLAGDLELSTARNQLPGESGFDTYIVRGNARSAQGVMQSAIRGEIIPSRTGFEVKSAAGRYVGIGGSGTVEDMTEDASCKGVAVTYNVVRGVVVLANGGRPLGRITGRIPKGIF